MALPQDISPINSELMDSLSKTAEMDWILMPNARQAQNVCFLIPGQADGSLGQQCVAARSETG